MVDLPSSSGIADPVIFHDKEAALPALLAILHEHSTFLVTSHSRPDGDAIGSALGVMHLLEALGKSVTVTFADAIPRPFSTLPGAERILHAQPESSAEVAIVLECDSVARTGFDHLAGRLLVNIDHHRSGSAFGAINWIDPEAPAVGSMIYDLAIASGAPLSAAFADCLYAAVLTDTVGFTLPSTRAETFGVARHLLELGADAAGIAEAVYFSNRESKLRVLGKALERLHVDGAVAQSAITQADMADVNAGTEDCEGIVQHLIGIEGVQAAAFLRELPGGHQLRASLRSKGKVDVASVAETFGGGGHRNASGCTLAGPLGAAADAIEMALQRACRKAQAC